MSLVDRLRKLYTGVVYDAAYCDVGHREPFVVTRDVRHLVGDVPLVGPAFTCWGGRPTDDYSASDAMRVEVFEALQPGSVVVMDTDQDATTAHFGDITASIFERAGVVGAVIDGYTRDLGEIHLPLFARGAQPHDAFGLWSLRQHSIAVRLSTSDGRRITVWPGDMVMADRDGVLILPRGIVEDVVDAAEERAAKEQEIRDWMAAGAGPREVYERIGRW